MKKIATQPRTSKTTDIWLTPKYIIDELGPFDLDPCTEILRPWDTAKQHFTIENDGLSKTWNGFVWCNPPYGNQTQYWLKKLSEHNNGIALIFARTETKMFFEHVWPKAKAILFIKGRLKFCYPTGIQASGNCGASSILIAYGDKAVRHLKNSNISGKLVYIN